jgi:UDP-N-acetylglucosamine 2-epimerase
MSREMKIAESVAGSMMREAGTWALPGGEWKKKRLTDLIKVLRMGEIPNDENPVTTAIGDLLGDDQLFDDLGKAQAKYAKEAAEIIVRHIKRMAKWDADEYKREDEYLALVDLAKKL